MQVLELAFYTSLMILALIHQKHFYSQALIRERSKRMRLQNRRTGLFLSRANSACFFAKLARLLQAIAHTALEEIKLMLHVDMLEKEMRQEKARTAWRCVMLGCEAPPLVPTAPCRYNHRRQLGFWDAFVFGAGVGRLFQPQQT